MRQGAGAEARVVIYTRVGCHLCADAEAVAARVCADVGVAWRAVDVDEDSRLRAAYTDHVPVTVVDGTLIARWFLPEETLRAALGAAPVA